MPLADPQGLCARSGLRESQNGVYRVSDPQAVRAKVVTGGPLSGLNTACDEAWPTRQAPAEIASRVRGRPR